MLKRLSHRVTALIGVIGMAVSLFLSGFATKSVGGMVFLQGFVFGLSGAVVFLVSRDSPGVRWRLAHSAQTAYTLPTQWFMKKRGLTAGITSCGGGVGGAVWAIVSQEFQPQRDTHLTSR